MITKKDVKKMKDIIKVRGQRQSQLSTKGKAMFDKSVKEKKVYQHNRNINDEEIALLKKQGKFVKCPYHAPQED